MGGILRLSPGFLCRAFNLIGDSAVRHFLVADGFAGFLFDLARNLIDLAAYLILIHDSLLLAGFASVVGPRSCRADLLNSSSTAN